MSYTARNSYKVALMYNSAESGQAASWTKLADIKSVPDLLPVKEQLETTTLSDPIRTFIDGIRNADGSMQFAINYNKADMTRIKALEDTELELSVWFGVNADTADDTPTSASDGKVSGKGTVSLSIPGFGVNAVVEANINVTPTGAWDWSAS